MNRLLALIKRKPLIWYLDTLSLGAVLQYAAFRFLQSTMFTFYYSDTYKMITIVLLLVFGGVRYVYLIVGKIKSFSEKKERTHFLLRCAFVWLLALPFFYVGWKHDYKFLIFLPICCMCLYDMEAGKILRTFAFTIGILLAATVLCCLSGTVRNLVKTRPDGQIVGAYGIINTSDFASYFTFLLLSVWCGMRNRRWYESVLFAVISAGVTFYVYAYTFSRTALLCSALLVAFIIWDCFEEYVLKEKKKLQRIDKVIKWLTTLAFPLIGTIVILLTILYSRGNYFATQLDYNLLTGRLAATWEPYLKYGIQPFGSFIDKIHGKGATIVPYWSGGYGYLDVAYAMIALRYGWVITCIIACIWVWMTARAIWSGNNRIAFAMGILAFHAFSEARVLDINYNVFLIMPFCILENKRIETVSFNLKKNNTITASVGMAALLSIFLILPRALSWLRTIFANNGWNTGLSAFNSLLICTGIIIFIFIFWRSASVLIQKRNRNSIFVMMAVSLLGVGIIIVANTSIETELNLQKNRLEKERNVVHLVQEAASLPVYAAEPSELYHRQFGGISDHSFSTEELGRFPKGSIFTGSDIEALGITTTGGLFTQISDETGLYTYDRNVIDALTYAGYKWTPYYSGERNIDLADLAVFNGKQYDKILELNANENVTTSNIAMDQIKGSYELSFDLSDFSDSGSEPEVTIKVFGDAGDREVFTEKLSSKAFDLNGHCNHFFSYTIDSTPKVSYAVSTGNNTHIAINNISWKQILQNHSDGVVYGNDGPFVMQTTVANNSFNLTQFQLYRGNTGEYSLTFGTGNECGEQSGEYIHELDDGMYYLVFKGNTNLADEWIRKLIRLEKGSTICYDYQIDDMSYNCIKIGKFTVTVDGENVNFFE